VLFSKDSVDNRLINVYNRRILFVKMTEPDMRRQNLPLPDDLDQRLTQVQTLLAAHRQVVFAYLFGGLAQGGPKPLSDVDIAVYLDESADWPVIKLVLIVAVIETLGSDALDLIVLNQAPLSLAGRIQQSNRLLVDKEPFRRHSYESLIRRQFADFQVFERRLLERRFGLGG
jgi:predicted nucleotidyltransferase